MMTSIAVCLKGRGHCPTRLLNSKHTEEVQWLRRERKYKCQCFFFLPFVESINFLQWYENAECNAGFSVFLNADTMMGQWSNFLIQFFNISITCATQKRRGLPNTELHICTIHFFFNNISDYRPFCCRRWCFPVNCVRTILNQKVKTLKIYTKVHLRVNECKTFTWQNCFQDFFFSNDAATTASSLSKKQWDTAKQQEEYCGHSPGGPGTDFSRYCPRDWPQNCVQS